MAVITMANLRVTAAENMTIPTDKAVVLISVEVDQTDGTFISFDVSTNTGNSADTKTIKKRVGQMLHLLSHTIKDGEALIMEADVS